MPSISPDTSDGGSSSSSAEAVGRPAVSTETSAPPSPPSGETPNPTSSEASTASSRLFRLGHRSLHSLRRLKDLEGADASLGTPQRSTPSSPLSATSAQAAQTAEGAPGTAPEGTGASSESEDDTFEVVRSMKDLQRRRGGPRKGLNVRVGPEEPKEAKDEEETEDAVGLLEKNFSTGGPGFAADRHLCAPLLAQNSGPSPSLLFSE